jgi:CHAT domain
MAVNALAPSLDSLDQAIASLQSLSPNAEQCAAILDQLGHLFFKRYQQHPNHALSDLSKSIDYANDALANILDDNSLRWRILWSLGRRLRMRFEKTGQQDDISQAILCAQASISAVPESQPGTRIQMIQELGDNFGFREAKSGNVNDACSAIEQYGIIAASSSSPPIDIPRFWNNVGMMFEAVCNKPRELESCDVVIHAALKIVPFMCNRIADVPLLTQYAIRTGLGEAMRIRYSRTKALQDLEAARAIMLKIRDDVGPQHRYFQPSIQSLTWIHGQLSNEALRLKSECESTANDLALDDALKFASQAFDFLSLYEDEELVARAANNRGYVLELVYDLRKDEDAIKMAEEMGSIAIRKTGFPHDLREGRINTLSRYMAKSHKLHPGSDGLPSLRRKFQSYICSATIPQNSAQCLLEEAGFLMAVYHQCESLSALTSAIDLLGDLKSRDDEANSACLKDYAFALVKRYQLRSDPEDLQKALSSATTALSMDISQGDPASMSYEILGNLKSERYLALNNLDDLQESIQLTEKALSEALQDRKSAILMNLGNKYRWRFEALGAGEDILRAVDLCRKSLETEARDLMLLGQQFNNLGEVLSLSYLHTGDVKYIDDAISQGERMESIWRNQRPSARNLIWISNFAIHLSRRAEWRLQADQKDGAESDIARAIELTQEAHDVAFRLQSKPLQAAMANNLGRRYKVKALIVPDRAKENLEKAVDFAREAVSLTESQDPTICYRIRNLGELLESLEDFGTISEREVLEAYRKAFHSDTANVGHRLVAARKLADRLLRLNDIAALDQEMGIAVELVPQLRIQALRRENQQQIVKVISGLTCVAASAALTEDEDDENRAIKAIYRLERGRGMIFGSLLDQREENRELYTYERRIYEELTKLQDTLESSSYDVDDDSSFDRALAGNRADSRIRTSQALDDLVAKIREIPRFKRFRLPPSINECKRAAEPGPIIILNVTEIRADAIIIQSTRIEVLPLPDLTLDQAKLQGNSVQSALDEMARIAMKGSANRKAKRDVLRKTSRANALLKTHCKWMWEAFVQRIFSHLGFIIDMPQAILPHIWWIGCGILSTFPIHAAGDYDAYPKVNAMKYCVSSYATTIKSLAFARRPRRDGLNTQLEQLSLSQESLLAIPMPATEGHMTDLSTVEELAAIKSQLPHSARFTSLDQPTCEDVLYRLQSTTIAHFACHGSSNPANPSHSRLLLTDYKTKPLTVSRIGNLRLNSTKLAYLSACHSAVSRAQSLANEGINIASAFQLAGFPSVVGTLWQALDKEAVDMAGKFYGKLFGGEHVNGGRVTGEKCARALHGAVREMAEECEGHFVAWASWIHVGD